MTEREWREATDIKPATFWLAVVLAVAAGLRFWRLTHGLPHSIGIGEHELASRVLATMRSGDFNPHAFTDPSLTLYLHLGLACVRFLAGAAAQEFRSLADVAVADLLPWARALTAAMGVATVALVHQIGMRWGARHALLAAGLMAVLPMHVRASHYALTDVPALFFTTLTFLLALAAHEKATVRVFAMAGAAAGLAMGTQYAAGFAVLMPLVAAWMTLTARPSRLACAGGTLLAWLAAFFVVAPYTLLDLPGFLDGFAQLMADHGPPTTGAGPAWLAYLGHVRLELGWPAFLLMLSGLGLGLVRAIKGPGRVRWTLLVVVPLLAFYAVSGRELVRAGDLLPAMPFACVLAACAVISGVSLLRRFDIPRAPRTALIVGLTVAAVLPPLVSAVQSLRTLSRTSTQDLAYRWIDAHVPEGARVVVERGALLLPERRFRVEYPQALVERTYEQHKAAGAQYLVASAHVDGRALTDQRRDRGVADAPATLRALGHEVARFSPAPGRPGPELVIIEVR